MGFLLTSTTLYDSTVLYHITHDKMNLYEQEELLVHSDITCNNIIKDGIYGKHV